MALAPSFRIAVTKEAVDRAGWRTAWMPMKPRSGNSPKQKGKPARRGASNAGKATAPKPKSIPPIVGIGASAGGLEAYTQLLRALPQDTGMAFVLVQHLEARHESMLTKLLAGVTPMPVDEARQGMRPRPNHLYVIPPNADMTISAGILQLIRRKAPAGRHLPIDHFFRSLAEDQGARTIGVILSGTASDGTLGITKGCALEIPWRSLTAGV